MAVLSLVSALCCQEEVSATGRSLVQRSRTVCVSQCDHVQQQPSTPTMSGLIGEEFDLDACYVFEE